MTRLWRVLGALFGLSGVGLAAAGAHALGASVQTAAFMQILHALALMALATVPGGWAATLAGIGFVVGILGFSGGITAAALGEGQPFLAPVGGVALMVGWAFLAIAGLRRSPAMRGMDSPEDE